jgi:hypothetical protein
LKPVEIPTAWLGQSENGLKAKRTDKGVKHISIQYLCL